MTWQRHICPPTPHGGERPVRDHGKAASIHQLVHDGGKAISALVHGRLGHHHDVCDTLKLAGMGGRSREERSATAMTLAMAATTTVTRTEAAGALGFQPAHPQRTHPSVVCPSVNI
jgi:hypothetical protein